MRCCTRINIYTQFSIIFCEIAEEHNLCLYGFMLKLKHRLKKKNFFFINLFVANLHIFPTSYPGAISFEIQEIHA